MTRKVLLFIGIFYAMTVVTAFLMAQSDEPQAKQHAKQPQAQRSAEQPQAQRSAEQPNDTPDPFSEPQPSAEPAEAQSSAQSPDEAVTTEEQTPSGSIVPHPDDEVGHVQENKVRLERPYVGESPQHWAFSFMGGLYRPLDYKGHGDAFNKIYEGDDPLLNAIGDKGVWVDLSLEWQFFKSFGHLGTKFSTGSWAISREFDSPSDQDSIKNKYVLWAVPAFLGGVYRLQYWANQPLVPFVEGGYGGFRFQQVNAEGANRYNNIYRQAYMAGGGIQLNTNLIDPKAARSFDIEWGVNRTYFTAEYRIIQSAIHDDFDFSGKELVTAGFVFEF